MTAADYPLYVATLRPHRSLTPRGVRILLGSVGVLSALISLPFFLMGAWPIVGFFGLDVLGLWLALRWNFHTARAREEVRVTPIEMTVRKVSHWGERAEWRFNPVWVRLNREDDPDYGVMRMWLVERGLSLDFGGFLGPRERARVAGDVSRALAEARRGPRFA